MVNDTQVRIYRFRYLKSAWVVATYTNMLFQRATSFWHVNTVTRLMQDGKLGSWFDLEMHLLTVFPQIVN